MNIWLITPHDAIPGETWGQRHAISLAHILADQGHNITYWATSFSHAMKRQRSDGWQEIQVQPNIRVILVPTRSYDKNVSLRRLWFYKDFAHGLLQRAKTEQKPDVLITTVGTPFTDRVVVKLSRLYNAWLITEFRDLWPEAFARVLPKPLRVLSSILLLPFYWERRFALQNSSAIATVCQTYLKYAQIIAPNVKRIPTRVMYHSSIQLIQFRQMMQCAEHDTTIPAKKPGEVWAIYAGMLGNNYDVPTLMNCARILSQDPEARNIKIIVAGDGPLRQRLTEFIRKHSLENLVYVGVLDMPRLCKYYAKSDIGLCIYARDSTVVIPAKAFDYYAAGLPIVNSLRGEFADYLRQEGIGVQYEAGDPVSLATALLELASDPQRRETMKRHLQEIAPMFDRDRQYAQIFDLLPSGEGRK
jgi:glycosyltransferase involved in cell wall biosynthesis